MRVEEIRELYQAAPFRPFEVVLANGRQVPVEHPEFMAFSPSGRSLVIFEFDGPLIIDVAMIAALKAYENGRRPTARKRKR